MVKLINIMLDKDKMREYIVKKAKAPLKKALIKIAERYPEPTKENCANPNTLILLDLRDKFFEYQNHRQYDPLWKAIWKIGICEYEHDCYFSQRANWFIEELKKSDWKENQFGGPCQYWDGPWGIRVCENEQK